MGTLRSKARSCSKPLRLHLGQQPAVLHMCESSVELRQQGQHVARRRECYWLAARQERIERTSLVQHERPNVGPVDEILCVQIVMNCSVRLAACNRGNHFLGTRITLHVNLSNRITELSHVVVRGGPGLHGYPMSCKATGDANGTVSLCY